MKSDTSLALELVRYRVHAKTYSKWRAIIAELGESDTNFLRALKEIHGINIDKKEDTVLYVVEDTQQKRLLAEAGTPNPTLLQILLTSRAMALNYADAIERIQRFLELQSK